MNQDLYPVTNDELERLIILNEECSEVQKIISKILRHGFSSVDPTNTEDVKPTNRKMLVEELGQLIYIIGTIMDKDVDKVKVINAMWNRNKSINTYSHLNSFSSNNNYMLQLHHHVDISESLICTDQYLNTILDKLETLKTREEALEYLESITFNLKF